MGEGSDPAGRVNRLQHGGAGDTGARHERRAPTAEQPREGVVAIGAWPAATSASATAGRPMLLPPRAAASSERLDFDRIPEPREPRGYFANRRRIRSDRCALQEPGQGGAAGIEKISEHVHIALVLDGGDFNARDDPYAKLARRRRAASRSPPTVS